MSEKIYVGSRLRSFDAAPEFDSFTKVVIHVSEELSYEAGTDSGRTLTLECPWGDQAMADNIAASLKGHQYQPYTAGDAHVDPAAELGDGITVRDIYSGIYRRRTKFGGLQLSTVAAPTEEEIDHEFPYVPKQERKVTRKLYNLTTELRIQAGLISAEVEERKSDVEKLNALLTVQAGEIAAKVSKTGGQNSSFGWNLLDDSWTIYANNSKVFQVTQAGAEVVGKITAQSGKIGGFDILSNYLSYNGQTWGGTNTTGCYFGVNGIQLGKNFWVDMQGNLYAKSGTFDGWIKAGRIEYGGDAGYFDGGGIYEHSISGGRLEYNTVSTSYTSGGINTSLGYANYANDVFNGNESPGRLIVGSLTAQNYFYFGNVQVTRKQVTVATPGGGSTTIVYLAC